MADYQFINVSGDEVTEFNSPSHLIGVTAEGKWAKVPFAGSKFIVPVDLSVTGNVSVQGKASFESIEVNGETNFQGTANFNDQTVKSSTIADSTQGKSNVMIKPDSIKVSDSTGTSVIEFTGSDGKVKAKALEISGSANVNSILVGGSKGIMISSSGVISTGGIANSGIDFNAKKTPALVSPPNSDSNDRTLANTAWVQSLIQSKLRGISSGAKIVSLPSSVRVMDFSGSTGTDVLFLQFLDITSNLPTITSNDDFIIIYSETPDAPERILRMFMGGHHNSILGGTSGYIQVITNDDLLLSVKLTFSTDTIN